MSQILYLQKENTITCKDYQMYLLPWIDKYYLTKYSRLHQTASNDLNTPLDHLKPSWTTMKDLRLFYEFAVVLFDLV